MNEIPTPRMHSMACNFPKGCSCGAADYNRLLDALTTAREKLEESEAARYCNFDSASKALKEVAQLRTELSRLRAENAAKDAQIDTARRLIESHQKRLQELGEPLGATADVSTTPPVCVPVEIVAKLLQYADHLSSCSTKVGRPCTCGIDDLPVLAAPFLAKGEK